MENSQFPAEVGDKTTNSDPTGESRLPDAFQHRFFSKPEGWTDQRLSHWIENNPLADLCLRLATFQVAPNGKRCFDPKGRLFGSKRLYSMIGSKVSRGTYNRMVLSSGQQWKFVEECWIANMHTVLLNQDFNPVLRDGRLFRAVRTYKLWFLNFAFSGSSKKITLRDGRRKTVFIPINFDRLLLGLKKLASHLQYAALSDMKSENTDPPPIPYWRGWSSQTNTMELTWFAGHLQRYKSILTDLQFTDHELANLCQIRTFGRALPCPTSSMCRDGFIEQMNILSNEYKTPPNVLETVFHFSKALGKRLNVREMPTRTHISVSTSGCFEASQSDGGLASVVSEWISTLDVPLGAVRVGPIGLFTPGSFDTGQSLVDFMGSFKGIIDIRDVYGDLLFPRPRSFYNLGAGLRSLGLKKKNSSFLDLLYGGAGLSTKKRKASKFLGEGALPSTVGKAALLVATSLAFKQGTYSSDLGYEFQPTHFLHIGRYVIPVYSGPVMRHHMIYRPVQWPKARLDCLAEPGAKTRPLGKNQAWFTLVTRAMRFMAEPIIARDGRARIGLRSTNKMWSFLKFLGGKIGNFADLIAQSSDYKASTDLIPLDLLEVIWRGFLWGLPKSHPFWVFYSLITCCRAMYKAPRFKRLTQFPDGSPNRRGSFMGEPISFLTLTLENLLVEEISEYYFRNPLEPVWSFPKYFGTYGQDPCCICGDDVAGIRTQLRRVKLFKRVATDMGWQFSSKDGMSRRIMIFCEDHAIIKTDNGKRTIEYVDVIKSRLLTTMSREHSENRSSILGKGRMLSNQLDYFENKFLKIAILSYFRNIFDRCYNYGIIRNEACKLPIYLPPCCGGMGLPIVDSIMPSFMWPYIGYIFKVLELPSESDRFVTLNGLSSLNARVKHGISSDVSPVLKEIFESYSRALPGESRVKGNSIYNDDFIVTLLREVYSVEVPPDPYTKKYDFSSLENEASRVGFVTLQSLPTEIERVLNFQKFLKGDYKKESRTFNVWLKQSSRFWKKVFREEDIQALSALGRQRFKSVALLERAVTRGFSGWIYVGDDISNMNLINSGPSMKVAFSEGSRLAGRMSTYADRFVPDS